MTDYKARPPYQPWYEGDFWSLRVRGMHWLACLMYRAALQGGWDLDPPCKIPANETVLRALCGGPPEDVWQEHSGAVLSMFDLSKDGSYYSSERQVKELKKYRVAARKRKNRASKGGKAKAQKALGRKLNSASSRRKHASGVLMAANQNQNQNQNQIKDLLSTSGEVAAKILRNYTEEEQCAIAEIWPYYLERCQRDPARYELTPQRVSKCVMRFSEARKKTGTFEGAMALMKEAIDNLAASDWHMGRDPKTEGKRYVDFIDHLFASWTVMEKRLNDKRIKIAAASARGPVSNVDADQELERQLGRKPQ